jgi:hypothetical protein
MSGIFILKGLQPVARGRGAIATTTPGFGFQRIRTLKGVPEMPDAPRRSATSTTRYRGRILRFTGLPGCSSRSLLDPGLPSPIPAGIKKRTFQNPILKGIGLESRTTFEEGGSPRLDSVVKVYRTGDGEELLAKYRIPRSDGSGSSQTSQDVFLPAGESVRAEILAGGETTGSPVFTP